MTLYLASVLLQKQMYVLLPPFAVAVRGNATLTLLALVIPYSGNTKVRCDPGFSLDTFYINKWNFCYPFYPFWEYCQG